MRINDDIYCMKNHKIADSCKTSFKKRNRLDGGSKGIESEHVTVNASPDYPRPIVPLSGPLITKCRRLFLWKMIIARK